jgi:hypothetical protein
MQAEKGSKRAKKIHRISFVCFVPSVPSVPFCGKTPCPSVIKILCVFCGYATLIANSGQRIHPSKSAIHP